MPANRLECAPDGLEERGTVARLGPWTQLGENDSQVLGERPAVAQSVRFSAQVRAERGDDGTVGQRRLLDRLSDQHTYPGHGEGVGRKPRLADARLTRYEQNAARTRPRGGERGLD